jgi:hypothetical protein
MLGEEEVWLFLERNQSLCGGRIGRDPGVPMGPQ